MFREKVIFAALLICLGGVATGCLSGSVPRLENSALFGAGDQFEIATMGSNREILPASWQLMHYESRRNDRPQKRLFFSSERVSMDWPDGQNQEEQLWWKGWDAEFTNQNSNGSILIGAVPWHPDVPSRNLDIMVKNIANDVSGSQLSIGWSAAFGKRVASKIVSGKSFVLGGKPAYRVTFDVVNLDQREHDPNSPETRIDLVLSSAKAVVMLRTDDGHERKVRGLLMLIHRNDVGSYEKTEPNFSDLLTRFRITAKAP